MYRTFIYTPRSGSRIVSPTRGNNNLIAVHTLRNKSHVIWSRFPMLELIREKHLASKEARFQLCDVLMQQCTNAIIIDNCGEISVISHDWTEWYHLLRLCSALGIPAKIWQEHALQALATGLGAFHESLGYVGPHPDPKMALDFSQPFPLHPKKEAEEEDDLIIDMNGCLIRLTPDGCRANDAHIPPVEVRSEFDDYEEYED